MRPRACAAILRGDSILMVRHRHDGREYWTLPGGGIEPGETPEEAAVREVREETGLRAIVLRFLFEETYLNGTSSCYCFLAQVTEGDEAVAGSDPEEAQLPEIERMLQDIAWLPLDAMADDGQIAKAMRALRISPSIENIG